MPVIDIFFTWAALVYYKKRVNHDIIKDFYLSLMPQVNLLFRVG